MTLDLYEYLLENRIEYERHDHPPVYTVEDAKRWVPPLAAAETKNLFLRDSKGKRHFLVIVPAEERVDIKALNEKLGTSRLGFGSPDRLKEYLGVDPGAVSIFAIVNDPERAVEVVIDGGLWEEEAFRFHPLVNTSTLVISRDGLRRFLYSTGHPVRTLQVPKQ